MGDLSDYQRAKVGVWMAGATVTETVQILGISRGTISNVMLTYKKGDINWFTKHKSDRSLVCLKGAKENKISLWG